MVLSYLSNLIKTVVLCFRLKLFQITSSLITLIIHSCALAREAMESVGDNRHLIKVKLL